MVSTVRIIHTHYRSNSDINQLFHAVRDRLSEPFTLTDIDLW